MIKLILIRHAKSCWETTVDDFMRPLSSRGIKDAHLVSEVLKPLLPKSFIVWSSPAKRAYNTSIIFCQNMNIPFGTIIKKDKLYTFELDSLEYIVKKCENKHQNLILFGHNDAITNFVNKFGDIQIDKVPTAGVVIIDFDQNRWEDINKGRIVKTIYPRELKL